MKKILFLSAIIFLSSCTENQRARKFGGSEEIELPENHRLINVAWKQDDLWLLTEDTTTHTFYCREKSSWGIWEGEITIK